MKSLAVVGQGFVGGSLTTVFSEKGYTVYVNDITGKIAQGGSDPFDGAKIDFLLENKTRIEELALTKTIRSYKNVKYLGSEEKLETVVEPVNRTISFVRACESKKDFSNVYFVCLPTPMFDDGECDVSIVERVLGELASVDGDRIAVVKSTIPPGTTEKWNKKFENTGLRVVFNPEFLREESALDDMRNQNRIVLGGPRPHINKVKQVFEQAFPNVPVIKTSSTTAEMVKYVTNIHLAVKVSLANEFYQICEALDKNGLNIDYDKVIEYATLDERLGKSHWKVPGPMPSSDTGKQVMGFAGSCFIKDLNALMCLAKRCGVDPKVMLGAWQKNLEVRPQRDWEKLVGRAVTSS